MLILIQNTDNSLGYSANKTLTVSDMLKRTDCIQVVLIRSPGKKALLLHELTQL